MNKRIIVYGLTRDKANNKLQQMLDDMRYVDVKDVKKGINDFRVDLKNGDHYIAVGANDSVRGYRWQYAIIDRAIDQETLDTIVFPTFTPFFNEELIVFKDSFEWF